MRISDLKEKIIIRRPYIDDAGNRHFEEKEFIIPYQIEIKNQSYRILSKGIDIAIIITIGIILEQNSIITLSSLTYLVPVSFLLINSILESLIGSSTGKLLLNIAVVDEDCKYLPIWKSLLRNIASIFLIILSLLFRNASNFWDYLDKKLNDYEIYIVPRNKIVEIKHMLK